MPSKAGCCWGGFPFVSVRLFQESAVCILGYLDLENNWEEAPFPSRAVFLVEAFRGPQEPNYSNAYSSHKF